MAEWTAYCAPGTRPLAALLLMLQGEDVTEVAEHPWLAGRTDIILVNQDAPKFPPEFDFAPLPAVPRCVVDLPPQPILNAIAITGV